MSTLVNVIGSDGFLGKALQRNSKNINLHCWSHSFKKKKNKFDLFDRNSWENLLNSSPETVLLLSWPGLPNYQNPYHLTKNLPLFIELVEELFKVGCKNIIATGTCYEYGNINGSLDEQQTVEPNNYYAIAKDVLRRSIKFRCEENNVRWVWARIFYPYGIDQNQNSLFPSLLRAIKENKKEFNITSGNQKRDFISANQVALILLTLCINPNAKGIYNCGTGSPTSIFEFVQKIVKDNNSPIKIKRGFYSDRIGEPKAFWANMQKFNSL